MGIDYVSNGFGQLLPHTTFVLDVLTGEPTAEILEIRSEDDIINNVSLANPILAGPVFGLEPILPNGAEGNQFLHARFTSAVDVDSVLSNLPSAQATGGLTGSIEALHVDPSSGEMTIIPGRSFVGGQTYSGGPSGDPVRMQLEAWVTNNEGSIEANANVDHDLDGMPDGLGFPGVLSSFSGAADLLLPESYVFIPDTDGDLMTYETFPAGGQILLILEDSVLGANGLGLDAKAVACSTVGPDEINPEATFTPAPFSFVDTFPANGDLDVDPATEIRIKFTESIQPVTLGDLPTYGAPSLSPAVSLQFGPDTRRVDVPFTVMPASPLNLTEYILQPAFHFPGQGPEDNSCGAFDVVDISINVDQFQDLAQIDVDGDGIIDRGNANSLSGLASFRTGEGPGLVNTPVTPDAIYAGRQGGTPGLSVVDLNGFGQSTGNPIYDDSFNSFERGASNFPNNPNVKLQGSLLKPALVPGECTVDGGSAGVFTLTLDSNLNDVLARAPLITSPGDMMLGHALDSSFNNAPAPYGCQSGGGNLCAGDGLKLVSVILGGPNTITPPRVIQPPPAPLNNINGGENIVSWAPHPNPPSISFPPLCVWPFLGTEEPTSIDVTFPPDPTIPALNNWLAPGDPFGDPNGDLVGIPTPPQGLLASEQNAWFDGPPLPQLVIAGCQQYKIRQQVGNFLYLLDRNRSEVVVLNSNRMNVIDRIIVPDPTELAMSPNIDLLAVSNQAVDLVSFIDIDPASASFHTIVKQTVVGDGPRGIAWESGNEDIIVCNENEGSASIISAFSLEVRKVVNSNLSRPFSVAITPRQSAFGFFRNVYFAYFLNRDGRVAIFESGPNEVNGWGYDDVIGTAPQTFQSPKAIQPDHTFLQGGVWICHEGPIDVQDQSAGSPNVPALSNLIINSGIAGILPLNVQSLTIPNFRDMDLSVRVSLGPGSLTGIPVDLAFDNLRNYGGLPNLFTVFSAGVAQTLNGKSLVRNAGTNGPQGANQCEFMFVAIPNPTTASNGNIDVIDITGGYDRFDTNAYEAGIQSIPVNDVTVLMDYFRQ
jgi:hypothetical protein